MSENCIRRWIKIGIFPKGVRFECNKVGWTEQTIQAWQTEHYPEIARLMKARQGKRGIKRSSKSASHPHIVQINSIYNEQEIC